MRFTWAVPFTRAWVQGRPSFPAPDLIPGSLSCPPAPCPPRATGGRRPGDRACDSTTSCRQSLSYPPLQACPHGCDKLWPCSRQAPPTSALGPCWRPGTFLARDSVVRNPSAEPAWWPPHGSPALLCGPQRVWGNACRHLSFVPAPPVGFPPASVTSRAGVSSGTGAG